MFDEGDRLRFLDTRPCALQRSWMAGELESDIYLLCDSGQTAAAVEKQVMEHSRPAGSVQQVRASIESLCQAKVLLPLNGKLVALATTGIAAGSRDGELEMSTRGAQLPASF
jgi:magnesium-protoporphyrin IX monomethyl ester (oxidative) cyclase